MRPPTGVPNLSKRNRVLLVVALAAAVLLMVGPRLVDTYVDWLWFGEVGFREVFTTVLFTRMALFLVTALVVGAVVFLGLLLAYRSRPVFVALGNPNDPVARYRTAVMRRPKLFAIGIPAVFGVFAGLAAQGNWVTVQMFLNSQEFGITDPEFGLDVGFYAFQLPFFTMVLNWLFVAVVVAFLANLVTHYIFGGLRLDGGDSTLTNAARIQLAVLAGTFVLLKAVAYWLDRYALLSSGRKEPTFTGAGFTDINAVLPAKLILLAIAVICGLAFFAAIVLKDLRVPALATALLVLSSVLVGAAWPMLMEQFQVRPNAQVREAEYIERNIAATRQAYGITEDRINYLPYPGIGTAPPETVPADVTTISNIRLLDPNIVSRTFTQQTQLKNFFGYPDILDVDRYEIDGELKDFIVAARELNPSALAENQRDWINRHTVYTHGNGFIAAPANRVNAALRDDASSTNSGYPIYAVADLSTMGSSQVIPVEQPRIYYGELIAQSTPDYAIVGAVEGSPAREYDSDTQQYTYTGEGGVAIGNWFNRLAFFAKYSQRNILFSEVIGPDSKIIFNRDPRDRVQKVAPWLTTDTNTYPTVIDGRIVWVVDAYTTLDNFPYAQRSSLEGLVEDSQETLRPLPRKEVSYIRNSVKATVDAYDGTVTLYEFDEEDPVLQAWMGVFPESVKPHDEIPDDLRKHFRYPEDLFKVQREMLAKYHVNDPREFFTFNNFWSVPSDPTVETAARANQPPYYVLVGDRETGEPSFQLTSPMVGFNRELLAAHIAVSSDPDNYGAFTIRQLPTDTQTPGPQQAQNTMITDTRVAERRTLLERSNRVQYGNLLTLPIANGGILYVEPLYTERNTGASTFPQLALVIASYRGPDGGDRVGFSPTLAGALSQIFGPEAAGFATAPGGTVTVSETTADAGPSGELPPPDDEQQPPADGEEGTAEPGDGTTGAPGTGGTASPEVVAELDAALQNLRTAQSSGNFADYGAALERLQRAVDAYEAAGGN